MGQCRSAFVCMKLQASRNLGSIGRIDLEACSALHSVGCAFWKCLHCSQLEPAGIYLYICRMHMLIHVHTYNWNQLNETSYIVTYRIISLHIVTYRSWSFYVSCKGRQPREAVLGQETRPTAVRSSMSVESTAPQGWLRILDDISIALCSYM